MRLMEFWNNWKTSVSRNAHCKNVNRKTTENQQDTFILRAYYYLRIHNDTFNHLLSKKLLLVDQDLLLYNEICNKKPTIAICSIDKFWTCTSPWAKFLHFMQFWKTFSRIIGWYPLLVLKPPPPWEILDPSPLSFLLTKKTSFEDFLFASPIFNIYITNLLFFLLTLHLPALCDISHFNKNLNFQNLYNIIITLEWIPKSEIPSQIKLSNASTWVVIKPYKSKTKLQTEN